MSLTLFALLSSVAGAFANILARTLCKDLQSREVLGMNFLIMAATLVVLSPFFYFFQFSLLALGLVVLIALIDTCANFLYFKTFEKAHASIATPLLSLAPAFTFVAAPLFFRDAISMTAAFATLAMIVLVVLFSLSDIPTPTFQRDVVIPGIFVSFLFGISAIPTKFLLDTLHAVNAPTLYMFRAALIALVALLAFRFPFYHFTVSQYRTLFIRGLFVIAQQVLLYYALSGAHIGVTMTLANLTPIFVFLFSIILLQERPTVRKAAMALCVLFLSFIIL